jgi:succinate dehydrogenase / fumarate reductase flavoprotein subunit
MTIERARYQEVSTDVLCIGGGGAGVMAAVAAARKGKKVALVLKGALGRSGNTIMAGASFAMDGPSAIEYGYDGDPAFTREVWFEEIVKQGFYLSDQKIVETYVTRAAPLVKQVLDWGQRAKQTFFFFKPGGFFTSGKAIGTALRRGVREHPQIELAEDVFITDLLTHQGRCVGALGIDVYSGELIVFKAKAVVLGTGGFQPFSFKCTVSDMTGDALGMALRAGLAVADMEFPLFVPGVCLTPPIHRGSIYPFIYNILTSTFPEMVRPLMKNASGEDIAEKMPPDQYAMALGSEWMKLVFTYWWGREIDAGNGSPNGGIYFSFDHADPGRFADGAKTMSSLMALWYKDLWRYQGDDLTDLRDVADRGGSWEIGLSHEYSNGGIVVDEKAQTGLPGLYAAGECSSGCFGAHRVHDALVEMLVQGWVAGESASDWVSGAPPPLIEAEQVEACEARITNPLSSTTGVGPAEVRTRIEAAADRGFGFVRDEERTRSALTEVMEIRQTMIPRMSLQSRTRAYNLEWIESVGLENLVLCLEAGLRAALERKESRGAHIRKDHPTVDHDDYLVRYAHHLEDQRMTLSTMEPVVTSMGLPKGQVPDVMAYALFCEPKFKNAAGDGSVPVSTVSPPTQSGQTS